MHYLRARPLAALLLMCGWLAGRLQNLEERSTRLSTLRAELQSQSEAYREATR